MKRLYGPLHFPKTFEDANGVGAIFGFLVIAAMLFYTAISQL